MRLWSTCLSEYLNQTTLTQASFHTGQKYVACYAGLRNTSLWLRFSSDFLLSTKCKAIFAVASFRNSSAHFLKPAWCFNFSELSDSVAEI